MVGQRGASRDIFANKANGKVGQYEFVSQESQNEGEEDCSLQLVFNAFFIGSYTPAVFFVAEPAVGDESVKRESLNQPG